MLYSLLHKSAMSDPMLYELFDRLADAGRIERSFSGNIVDHHQFRNFCRREDVHFWAMCADGDPAGFINLDNVQIRKAWAHFAFFGRLHPVVECRLCRFAVASLLRLREEAGDYILDVLYGFTPSRNREACRFARLVGLRQSGSLPLGHWNPIKGENEDFIINYATRELFPERYLDENIQ